MNIKSYLSWPELSWRLGGRYTLLAVVAFAVVVLYLVAIKAPAGLMAGEASFLANLPVAASFSGLLVPAHILYFPYSFLILNLPIEGALALRLLSAVIGVMTALAFYLVLKQWFDRYYAMIASVLAVGTTVFASIATTIGPHIIIMLFTVLSLLSVTLFYRGDTKGYLLAGVTIPLSLYFGIIGWIVGGMQLAVLGYVLNKRRMQRPRWRIVVSAVVIALVILAPAGYLLMTSGAFNLYEPVNTPSLRSLGTALAAFIVGAETNVLNVPATWPLLDLASLALLFLGVMVAIKRRKADRHKLLLGFMVVALVLLATVGQSREVLATAMIPVAITITTGLRYLSDSWRSVFPNNNVAHFITNFVTALLVIGIVGFHLLRFLSLLPQLPQYQQQFEAAPEALVSPHTTAAMLYNTSVNNEGGSDE